MIFPEGIPIRHEILHWARESLGLSPEEAMNRFRRAARADNLYTYANPSLRRMLSFENGVELPFHAELDVFAKIYRLPSAVFFFPSVASVKKHFGRKELAWRRRRFGSRRIHPMKCVSCGKKFMAARPTLKEQVCSGKCRWDYRVRNNLCGSCGKHPPHNEDFTKCGNCMPDLCGWGNRGGR